MINMTKSTRRRIGAGLTALTVLIVILVFLIGIITNIRTSFMTPADISVSPPKWIFEPTMVNYLVAIATGGYNFGVYLYNSLVIALGSVAAALFITVPAAYSIVRYRGLGDFVLGTTLLVRLMPALSFAIPVYVVFSRFNLIDTHLAIILMHTLFISPTALLLLVGFVQELPKELEEAAIVDGATTPQLLFRILIPTIKPGIAAVAILGFILSWNEFIFAVVLSFRRVITAPVGTSFFITSYAVAWGPMAAAITMASIPTMIFIFVAQRTIIQGMTAGAVKG